MFHSNNALLGTLTERLTHEELFDRQRKATETRALGLLLHHAGLSCRRTRDLVSILAEPAATTRSVPGTDAPLICSAMSPPSGMKPS